MHKTKSEGGNSQKSRVSSPLLTVCWRSGSKIYTRQGTDRRIHDQTWNFTHLPCLLKVYGKDNVTVLSYGCENFSLYAFFELSDHVPWSPAAWHIDAICADERRSGRDTRSSRSTSGLRFILFVTVWNMRRFSLLLGVGNSIFLSNRPGRSKAGSRVSARLVAIITLKPVRNSSEEQKGIVSP